MKHKTSLILTGTFLTLCGVSLLTSHLKADDKGPINAKDVPAKAAPPHSKDAASAKTDATREPDNTARNGRDRDGRTLTPVDQGSSKNDTEITALIRKEIMAAKNMSVNAQNVKIITVNGKVTLRGPVNNADEKRLIGEIAGRQVRTKNVDSQLEVK